MPNSTDAWGALSEAPGIRMQGFDVGGSHKSQQSGYEVFGIQNQSRIVTDGVDHTEGVGGTGYYEDYYSNEEVSISALGSDVEMNSGGAAIVSTIKSGGNQFKGLENFTYEDGQLGRRQQATPNCGARLHREPQPAVLRRARRSRRADHDGTRPGSTRAPTTVQDRQGRLGRAAERRHRPRPVPQLHGPRARGSRARTTPSSATSSAGGSRSRSATSRP